MLEQVKTSCAFLEGEGILQPDVAVILGTGSGDGFVAQMEHPRIIQYADIPNFPVATVDFHKGNLIFGEMSGRKVVAMQGRFHYYEGFTMQQVTFPVRVMKMLGARHLLISNAAGNMNPDWQRGELMLLDDHINLQPDNPLRGVDHRGLGSPFPDMSQPYAAALNDKLLRIARELHIRLHVGIYAAVAGPNLETRAEYRFLRGIGADVVGMSTVPEVIVANQVGLSCCALSVLTDDCDPENLKPARIEDIIEVARRADGTVTALFSRLIATL